MLERNRAAGGADKGRVRAHFDVVLDVKNAFMGLALLEDCIELHGAAFCIVSQ